MINIIKNSFNFLDLKIRRLMKFGMFFALFISIIATTILIFYIFNSFTIFYYIGIYILKLSFIIFVNFVICGYTINSIKSGY